MESSVGLYYNKAILQEAGIEVPEAGNPWTFSEFFDIPEQLKPLMESKNGYAPDMTFPVGEATIYYYAPFIWANGGELASEKCPGALGLALLINKVAYCKKYISRQRSSCLS